MLSSGRRLRWGAALGGADRARGRCTRGARTTTTSSATLATAMQRLPCLLTSLVRDDPATRKREKIPINDVRELGCGRRFTAALTWGGEVWVWGELGGKRLNKPTVIERLLDATIVRIACGAEHVAMLTGDREREAERLAGLNLEQQHADALHKEAENLEQRRVENVRQQEEAARATGAAQGRAPRREAARQAAGEAREAAEAQLGERREKGGGGEGGGGAQEEGAAAGRGKGEGRRRREDAGQKVSVSTQKLNQQS